MAQIRRNSIAPRTFAMRLLIGFAILATALALVGIYGVLSLSVGSRVKEIAVRKAVGAQRHDILRLILGEGSRMIAVGIVLGAVVAIFVGRALENYLFDVTGERSAVAGHRRRAVRLGRAGHLPPARDPRRADRSAERAASRLSRYP